MSAEKSPNGIIPFTFTPAIDARIIRGYLGDKEAMFEELAQLGCDRKMALKRGANLGLNRRFLRECQSWDDIAVRQCLRCEKGFLSTGPQNRMCHSCRVKK